MNDSMKTAWEADMARVDVQVHPYVYRHDDWAFVSDECPKPLYDLYAKLVQVGYANGYIN